MDPEVIPKMFAAVSDIVTMSLFASQDQSPSRAASRASFKRSEASSRALRDSRCSVMSRAILEAPMTFPFGPLIGETVSEMSISLPSFRTRTVS